MPNGNAPMPSDIWNPPSPNPKPWNVVFGSGSVRWPAGLGGTFALFCKSNGNKNQKKNMIMFQSNNFRHTQCTPQWVKYGSQQTHRGSSSLVLPRPYNGITFSLLMAALHTGHSWRFGRVSSHWCKHGQQNKWPHILTTASFAVSKQILHSNIESSFLVLFASFCCLAFDVSVADAVAVAADDDDDWSFSGGCMFSLFMILLALGALLISLLSIDWVASATTDIGSDNEDIFFVLFFFVFSVHNSLETNVWIVLSTIQFDSTTETTCENNKIHNHGSRVRANKYTCISL